MATVPFLAYAALGGRTLRSCPMVTNLNLNLKKPSLQICCVTAQPRTLEIVRETMAAQLCVDKSEVRPESKLVDLYNDSLDKVESILNIEDTFGVEIDGEEADNIVTVQDTADTIQGLLDKK